MRRMLVLLALAATSAPAQAHYCSNIFAGPARLVIKPEQSTVHVTAGSDASLKVYLQNNFPYKLFNVQMSGSATGYTISVTPAGQAVGPGQQVLFTYTIKGSATADVQVSSLNLKVKFRLGTFGQSDSIVNQSPSQATLVAGTTSSFGSGAGQQVPALNAATLADRYPTAKLTSSAPFFGRDAVQQLIQWFGYRFCYYADGGWACGGQNCPDPCTGDPWTDIQQFPMDCMRAGIELGARKAKLGSHLQAARDAAVNALTGGSVQHRCLAAVVGGLLWQGASPATPFENALSSLPAICKAAGLRALGKGSASSCTSGQWHEQAACAGAEGLAGNDAVVTSVLVPNAGDGDSSKSTEWQKSHFYAYMLYLASMDRYARGQEPTWYPQVGPKPEAGPSLPEAGGPAVDAPPPRYSEAGQLLPGPEAGGSSGGGNRPGEGCGCQLGPEWTPGPLLALLAVALLLGRRRRYP